MSGLVFAAFDPGIASPGLAALRREASGYTLLQATTVRTKAIDPLVVRCEAICAAVGALLREHHPEVFALEEQRGPQVGAWREGEFRADNSLTMIAFGCALGTANAYGVKQVIVNAKRAKIAVLGRGSGNADKRLVRERVLQLVGGTRLSLDASDAVALAIAAAQMGAVGRVA